MVCVATQNISSGFGTKASAQSSSPVSNNPNFFALSAAFPAPVGSRAGQEPRISSKHLLLSFLSLPFESAATLPCVFHFSNQSLEAPLPLPPRRGFYGFASAAFTMIHCPRAVSGSPCFPFNPFSKLAPPGFVPQPSGREERLCQTSLCCVPDQLKEAISEAESFGIPGERLWVPVCCSLGPGREEGAEGS